MYSLITVIRSDYGMTIDNRVWEIDLGLDAVVHVAWTTSRVTWKKRNTNFLFSDFPSDSCVNAVCAQLSMCLALTFLEVIIDHQANL